MDVEYLGLSDVGMVRKDNEDAFFCDGQNRLFIVCDGIGGHVAGQLASSLAVDAFRQHFFSPNNEDDVLPVHSSHRLTKTQQKLIAAINKANYRILEETQAHDHLKGMGTTMVSLFLEEDKAHILNVGDSRCYRLREEKT